MSGVNKVILIGNLGADPEVRHLPSGIPVANFRIATSETFKDKTTGEKREQTEWHNVVAWRGLAEVCEKYLRKGSKVYVEGKLRNRQWQDKDGNTRYTTEIQADEMQMLDRAGAQPGRSATEGDLSARRNVENSGQAGSTAAVAANEPDEMDDLPF